MHGAKWAWCFGLALFLATPVQAENSKISVVGDRVIYDTENVPDGVDDSIAWDDVDALLDVLRENAGITTVELNSTGGSVSAAEKMASALIDFEVNTYVHGECSSTCVRLFLAGETRSMSRGSRIGFHQTWWSVEGAARYYERNAQSEGWDSPFEFASWMYSDTQSEVHERLIYMIRRGVDPVFAIQTLRYTPDEMWYPYRVRLLAAGVLTE